MVVLALSREPCRFHPQHEAENSATCESWLESNLGLARGAALLARRQNGCGFLLLGGDS